MILQVIKIFGCMTVIDAVFLGIIIWSSYRNDKGDKKDDQM